MIPPAFHFHAPRSLSEAAHLLAELGDDAKLLAGGHSLLPLMKLRFAEPAHLIDLAAVKELRGIREEDGMVCIGAMTTERELISSPLLQRQVPLLPEVARQIGDPQVRNRGTIGGDIAHGDPANDHPAIAIALGADFVLLGPNGERTVAAERFFHGTFATELRPDEILKEIRMRPFQPGTGYAYSKLKRKTGDWATAAAAVVMRMAAGQVSSVRIALTNLGAAPIHATQAESVLLGKPISEVSIGEAARAAMDACDPTEDLRGDREYKRAMAGEMTRRALRQALLRCNA
jgi:carbon-monoxide dehydrogenase medium subunit